MRQRRRHKPKKKIHTQLKWWATSVQTSNGLVWFSMVLSYPMDVSYNKYKMLQCRSQSSQVNEANTENWKLKIVPHCVWAMWLKCTRIYIWNCGINLMFHKFIYLYMIIYSFEQRTLYLYCIVDFTLVYMHRHRF